MDELLGSHIDEEIFERFLEDWPSILGERVAVAAAAMGEVSGVEGLLLAGSNGGGSPWPLSDIDFIPIYSQEHLETARNEVEQVRLQLLDSWSHSGWRTGVDVGRLYFTLQELETAFVEGDPDPVAESENDRWYYSLDKGYRSRVLIECGGYSQRLSSWFTSNRFHDEVVASRVHKSNMECSQNLSLMKQALSNGERVSAYVALLKSIQWFQVRLMEEWRARDNSQGRFGTRFENLAVQKGLGTTVADLHRLGPLSESDVKARIEQSPWWVKERRDRSWRARICAGEEVSQLQNERDVLRVCAIYQLRLEKCPPCADWLAVPPIEEIDVLGRELEGMIANSNTILDCF